MPTSSILPKLPENDVCLTLTPHMREYDALFSDSGAIRWVPYVMYFQPAGHRSRVVNTDSLGFRFTQCDGRPIAVAEPDGIGVVNVLAGSSTVFGIGATSDATTLASRMNARRAKGSPPWVNMGGRSHNSTQELLLYVLLRHRLPHVEHIVIFSGFNDLALARLPSKETLEGGAFFLCHTFFERLSDGQRANRRPIRAGHRDEQGSRAAVDWRQPDVDLQTRRAAALVLSNLDTWRMLAKSAGAKLTYVLQPLAGWVRDGGCEEERQLFAYLDKQGRFSETYGDISTPMVGERYARLLREGCVGMGVHFVDMRQRLAAALADDDWMFVDRIHFSDFGHDLTAELLQDVT